MSYWVGCGRGLEPVCVPECWSSTGPRIEKPSLLVVAAPPPLRVQPVFLPAGPTVACLGHGSKVQRGQKQQQQQWPVIAPGLLRADGSRAGCPSPLPCRAVLLTLVTGWTIDRLYEGGVDDVVSLAGLQLATPQMGALLATVACSAASVALLVQRQLFPLKKLEKVAERVGKRINNKGKGSTDRQHERTRRAITKLKRGIAEQQQWGVAIEAVRDVVEWASYSTSFLLTGACLVPRVLVAC